MTGSNFESGTIVACRYSPPGNVAGQFRDNVLPLTDEANGTDPSPIITPSPSPDSPSPDDDLDIDWLQGNYLRVKRDAVAVLTFKVRETDDDSAKCLDRERIVDRVTISRNAIQCPVGSAKLVGKTSPAQWGLQPTPEDAVTGGEACNSRTKVTWFYFFTTPRGVNTRRNRCHRATIRLADGTTRRMTLKYQ